MSIEHIFRDEVRYGVLYRKKVILYQQYGNQDADFARCLEGLDLPGSDLCTVSFSRIAWGGGTPEVDILTQVSLALEPYRDKILLIVGWEIAKGFLGKVGGDLYSEFKGRLAKIFFLKKKKHIPQEFCFVLDLADIETKPVTADMLKMFGNILENVAEVQTNKTELAVFKFQNYFDETMMEEALMSLGSFLTIKTKQDIVNRVFTFNPLSKDWVEDI